MQSADLVLPQTANKAKADKRCQLLALLTGAVPCIGHKADAEAHAC